MEEICFMNPEMMLTFGILAVTIVVFIWDKLRVDVVAVLALLSLVITGILDSKQALAGFSNSTVIMIAALFVVGGGLFKTGVADWLGAQLLRFAGDSEIRLIVMIMISTALLSGFLSNTGTVAVLLPAVVAAAWRIGSMPSKLLIPLAFAASIGGMLTLIGTPPNIVIANALRDAGHRPFGFFEFSMIGLPLLLVGVLYMVFVGKQWIPERNIRSASSQGGFTAEELAKTYHLEENLFRLRVRRGSSLVGKALSESYLGRDYGVNVVSIEHVAAAPVAENGAQNGSSSPLRTLERTISGTFRQENDSGKLLVPTPDTVIQADDVLVVEGAPNEIHQLAANLTLAVQLTEAAKQGHPEEDLLGHEIGLTEIIIPPRSALIGRTIIDTRFGEKYNVQVVGINRRGKSMGDVPLGPLKLAFGDSLLVRGTWKNIGLLKNEARNFVVVGEPVLRSEEPRLTTQSYAAIVAMLGMLVMMLTGIFPTVIAVIITAVVMVLTGCLTMEQAYRSISWESVILIAAMIPMSTALQVTGGAEFIATGLVSTLGAVGPLLLLGGIFLLTTGFTQVISNTATTILVVPIALNAATEMGISPYPVMMVVAVAASAAFLTPIASPVNTLVLTPGGYKFSDFIKTGVPLLLLFLVISLLIIPLIWPM
jgi:di/tricarboxylate transporter